MSDDRAQVDRAIHYCDRCGKMIPPGHEAGAVVTVDRVVCAQCLAELGEEERAALSAAARPDAAREARTRSRPRRTSSRVERAPARGMWLSTRAMVLVGVGGGGLVGLVAAIVILATPGGDAGGDAAPPVAVARPAVGAPRLPAPSVPPAPVPAPVPVTDAPAKPGAATPGVATGGGRSRARLAEIKRDLSGDFGNYTYVRGDVLELMREQLPHDVAAEAKAFLDETDAEYVRAAEAALAKAIASSSEFCAAGRCDEASAVLGAIRARFGAGDWYETKAKSRIEAETRRIDQRREEQLAEAAAAEHRLAKGSLVGNGSMSHGAQRPTGWTTYGAVKIARDTEVYKEGPASLRVESTNPAESGNAGTHITVGGGARVRVSGWVKVEGRGRATLVMLSFPKERGKQQWAVAGYVDGPCDWRRISKDITAESWAHDTTVMIFVEKLQGKAWLDEVVVLPVDERGNVIESRE